MLPLRPSRSRPVLSKLMEVEVRDAPSGSAAPDRPDDACRSSRDLLGIRARICSDRSSTRAASLSLRPRTSCNARLLPFVQPEILTNCCREAVSAASVSIRYTTPQLIFVSQCWRRREAANQQRQARICRSLIAREYLGDSNELSCTAAIIGSRNLVSSPRFAARNRRSRIRLRGTFQQLCCGVIGAYTQPPYR